MKGLLIFVALVSLNVHAGGYSNIPEKCIKNGVMVCYGLNPAVNGEKQGKAAFRKSEYAGSVATGSGVESVPPEVESGIRLSAQEKWGSNYRMQAYEIKRQTGAYKEVQSFSAEKVPETIAKTIKSEAIRKWPGNYRMQLYEIKKQTGAYISLQR